MPKRGASKEKQMGKEVMTNFPEEGPINLLSPRYLAVAASLILVFAAFASLLQESTTGLVTKTKQDWEAKGWTQNFGKKDNPVQNVVRPILLIKVPETVRCPKTGKILPPPLNLLATTNSEGYCYNGAKDPKGDLLPVCQIVSLVGGTGITRHIQQEREILSIVPCRPFIA